MPAPSFSYPRHTKIIDQSYPSSSDPTAESVQSLYSMTHNRRVGASEAQTSKPSALVRAAIPVLSPDNLAHSTMCIPSVGLRPYRHISLYTN